MIRTLVVGFGYWGRVMTRNLVKHPLYFVAGVYDPDPQAREDARSVNLYTFHTLQDALDFTSPDLVVVASPIGSQAEIALTALSRHANVMLAKPGAVTLDELRSIDLTAQRKDRIAVIDYTMRHAYGFQMMRRESESYGRLLEIDARRHSVGTRSAAPILYDMLVHDIALMHDFSDDDWRVTSIERGAHRLIVRLETDEATALLEARTDAQEAKRTFRVSCSHTVWEWDQLEEAFVATPVERCLADLYVRISQKRHDMGLEYRVLKTMSQIGAA